MSYDIWLEIDAGGAEPSQVGNLDWNYTSNCAAMWRLAMPTTDGLAGMDGMDAGSALPILERGIERMRNDPKPYMALEPDNGWGNFHSQLAALGELLEAFASHPRAKVAISR